jgi:hypothetical protein
MTMLIREGLRCVYRARRCGWIIEISIINDPELQGVFSNDTICDVGCEGSTSGGVLWCLRDTDAARFSSSQIQWIPTGAKYCAVVKIPSCHFFIVLSKAACLLLQPDLKK